MHDRSTDPHAGASVVAQDEAQASSPEVAILKDFAFELMHVRTYHSAGKNTDQRLSRSTVR